MRSSHGLQVARLKLLIPEGFGRKGGQILVDRYRLAQRQKFNGQRAADCSAALCYFW